MALMFLLVDRITDDSLFQQYQADAGAVLDRYPHELVAYDEAARPVERIEDTRRVMAVRFDNEEAFHSFYHSPEYQAAIGKRLGATDGFALLVNVA
jgi:uncharacterized protein (DUF1330 family)